jgi:hypothetical protein
LGPRDRAFESHYSDQNPAEIVDFSGAFQLHLLLILGGLKTNLFCLLRRNQFTIVKCDLSEGVVTMPFDISVAPCESYEAAVCRAALEQVLEPLGGLDWVTPGMKIAVKVNLVAAMHPEQAATTHPALLCELTKMLLERGAMSTLLPVWITPLPMAWTM